MCWAWKYELNMLSIGIYIALRKSKISYRHFRSLTALQSSTRLSAQNTIPLPPCKSVRVKDKNGLRRKCQKQITRIQKQTPHMSCHTNMFVLHAPSSSQIWIIDWRGASAVGVAIGWCRVSVSVCVCVCDRARHFYYKHHTRGSTSNMHRVRRRAGAVKSRLWLICLSGCLFS